MIGASFNQYRITPSISAGGMGEVFRARDTRLNRDEYGLSRVWLLPKIQLKLHAMKMVTMLEFRQDAEGVLRRIAKGERLVLSHRGKPAARLEPLIPFAQIAWSYGMLGEAGLDP